MNIEYLVFLYIFYSAFLVFHVCKFNIIKKKIFVTVGCIIWKTGFVEMIPINPLYVKLDDIHLWYEFITSRKEFYDYIVHSYISSFRVICHQAIEFY